MAEPETALLAPVYPLPRLELVKGRGTVVLAADGREYLDFMSGIAVNALGHAPPGLRRAVAGQMKSLVHVSNFYANRPAVELAQALTESTGLDRVFFCNSGTEAVDAALKFARARARATNGDRRGFLAFKGGFHGRTGFALSCTWNPKYREPFEPLVPGVKFGEFNNVDHLEEMIDGLAAVIVEPVQGEGGAIPATPAFLEALRELTLQKGAALIFDEVQCGMGRTGRLTAAEHYGVRPDIMVLSKALGGGLPLGAVLMNADTAGSLAPGMHGCTFGGGPVVTTAGLWALEKIRRPAFLDGVRRRAKQLSAGLRRLASRYDSLSEARGLGLLQAVEISAEAPFDPQALIERARAEGLLLVRGGERAVRFLPPLTVKPREIVEALRRFEAALHVLSERKEA